MVKELDLLNHYEIKECEYGYQFLTAFEISYTITFIEYPTVSICLSTPVFMLNIERGNVIGHGHSNGDDNRVRNTILYLIKTFFEKNEKALITLCDVVDGRQGARKKLFDQWYKEFSKDRFCKLDASCYIEEEETFASLFFRNDTYDRTNLEKAFQELVECNFYS